MHEICGLKLKSKNIKKNKRKEKKIKITRGGYIL